MQILLNLKVAGIYRLNSPLIIFNISFPITAQTHLFHKSFLSWINGTKRRFHMLVGF